MSAAFTPGPWSLGPWIDSMGGNVYRVVTGAGRKLSSVCVYGKRPDGSVGGRALKGGGHTKTIPDAECEANAHLIAAAPELYDGCNALLGLVQLILGRDDLTPELREVLTTNHRIEEAEKATAKARGETP